MHTEGEPLPARWRRPASSRYRTTKVALAVTAGLLLTAGFTMPQARAAVTTTAKGSAISAVRPDTLKGSCTSTNNSTSFWGSCKGTGPTSYRAVAFCADGDAVFGIEHWDGDTRGSTASCTISGLNSTLDTNWGYLLCSTSNGNGTYEGYVDKHGDISGILDQLGAGNIPAGGNFLCEYDTSGDGAVAP
jgi:hypothetical protein